jgi:hypothetical protein
MDHNERQKLLVNLREEGRKQPGVEFPDPGEQPHILVIRADLNRQVRLRCAEPDADIVRRGLRRLFLVITLVSKGNENNKMFSVYLQT